MLFHSLFLFSSLVLATPSRPASIARRGTVPAYDGAQVIMSPGEKSGEYPRSTNKQADGSLIGAFAITTADTQMVLKSVKSTDGGKSWKALGEVVSLPHPYNPTL